MEFFVVVVVFSKYNGLALTCFINRVDEEYVYVMAVAVLVSSINC